jgi:hypothetical protein
MAKLLKKALRRTREPDLGELGPFSRSLDEG